MFSTRASPYKNFIGVPRDVPPAFSIQEIIKHHTQYCSKGQESEQIPKVGRLDLCCVTHDHYDHMDTESVKELKEHIHLWIVPLGLGNWLAKSCSIDQEKIVELQWWQQLRVGKVDGRPVVLENDGSGGDKQNNTEILTITCCPSSHWAGRTVSDRNTRLWCSFAFSSPSFKIFFCGDSGYPNFPLFRQIGDALGPFDLSCIPIGAYEPQEMNKDSHCNPEEAVKIHKDLRSKESVAIHWGSFQLAEESMDAPPKDLEDAVRSAGDEISPIKFITLGHGETWILKDE